VNDRTWAAITYFVVGGIALLRGVSNVLTPPHSFLGQPWSEPLFRWGGAVSGLAVGGALVVVGLLTLRAKDPAESTKALHFINEPMIPLRGLMAGFLLMIMMGTATSILPYTGERGVEPGQLAVAGLLIPMFGFGAWVILHYRRLAIVNGAEKAVEIIYGKPWAAWRRSLSFADYSHVSIQVVPRARGAVYRVVAAGSPGHALITFTFSEAGAKTCAENIARETGWKLSA